MACHLLGIQTIAEMNRSPFPGSLFEGFIAGEILKSQINRGGATSYTSSAIGIGLEVDFLFPGRDGQSVALAKPFDALKATARDSGDPLVAERA